MTIVRALERLDALVHRLALAIAIVVGLLIPAGFFGLELAHEHEDLADLARRSAEKVARLAYIHEATWRFQTQRVGDEVDLGTRMRRSHQQEVRDGTGRLVARTGSEPAWPVVRREVPVEVAGRAVGSVAVETSLRPILLNTVYAALIGLALALSTWLVVDLLPLRLARRSMDELERAHRALEHHASEVGAAYSELERHHRSAEEQAQELAGALRSARDAELRADEANRAKSSFLAQMSHELRTPLNAIIGFSEVISEQMLGPDATPRYRDYARDILASGQHLLAIINDILDVSKIEAGRLELAQAPLTVMGVLEECAHLVQQSAVKAGVVLGVAMPAAPLPPVMAHETRLKQVVLNLLSNAIKFTPAGGRVLVSAERRDRMVAITVADTGIGMSPEEIALALQPFGQIDNVQTRRHSGTGLGLPLAKGLVELQGGTLTLDSIPGEGTVVRVTLPVADGYQAAELPKTE